MRPISRLEFYGLYLSIATVAILPSVVAPAQAVAPAQQTASTLFEFEVAAIKPNSNDGATDGGWRFGDDSFSVTNLTVEQMLFFSYDLKIDGQLLGLPKWADTDRWDIQARIGDESLKVLRTVTPQQASADTFLMLQNLLVQRFHISLHRETRDLPIYELTLAKGGSKLKTSTSNKPGNWSLGDGKFKATGVEAAVLAHALSGSDDLERVVVDKTGLTGRYDIQLKWTPVDERGTADSGPSLFTALEEQLGLKLVAAKGPVDVIVIDHIEHPSEN